MYNENVMGEYPIRIKDGMTFNEKNYTLISKYDYQEGKYMPKMITNDKNDIFEVIKLEMEKENFRKILKNDEQYNKYINSNYDTVINYCKASNLDGLLETKYAKLEDIDEKDLVKYLFIKEENYNNISDIKFRKDTNELVIIPNNEVFTKEMLINAYTYFKVLEKCELLGESIKSATPILNHSTNEVKYEYSLNIEELNTFFLEDFFRDKVAGCASEVHIDDVLNKVKERCPYLLSRVEQLIIMDLIVGNLENIHYDNYIAEYKGSNVVKYKTAADVLEDAILETKNKIISANKNKEGPFKNLKIDKNNDGLINLKDIKILDSKNSKTEKTRYRMRQYINIFNVFSSNEENLDIQKRCIYYMYSRGNQSIAFYNQTSANVLDNLNAVKNIFNVNSLLAENRPEFMKKMNNFIEMCKYTEELINKHNEEIRLEYEKERRDKIKSGKQKISKTLFKIGETLNQAGESLVSNEDPNSRLIKDINLSHNEEGIGFMTYKGEKIECDVLEVKELKSIKVNGKVVELEKGEYYKLKAGDNVEFEYSDNVKVPITCEDEIFVKLNSVGNYEFVIPKSSNVKITEDTLDGETGLKVEVPKTNNTVDELEYYDTGIAKNPYH